MINNDKLNNLALFGGDKLFSSIKSTSNLVTPSIDGFLKYSKKSYLKNSFKQNSGLVELLENRLGHLYKSEYTLTFSSGFWAIALVMKLLALPEKKEVIMPSFTYRRMADLVSWLGLTPHFCEVDAKSFAISKETAAKCINKNTALILGVHPIVSICDVEGLIELGKENSIPVMFDSVESAYKEENGKIIGSFDCVDCFSMHASKLLNGFEGGYITLNDKKLYEDLKELRALNSIQNGDLIYPGINAQLNEVHAALALASLDDLPSQIKRNKQIYDKYIECCSDIKGIKLLRFNENDKNAYKNIVIEVQDTFGVSREVLILLLQSENMLVRALYDPPLHKKEVDYEQVCSELPFTEQVATQFILMPCGDFVSTQDVEKICDFIKFISQNNYRIIDLLDKSNKGVL